jgi:hypothetical protein
MIRDGTLALRIPSGIFLILAGYFRFLPVLGLWMLPLGLLLLAQDVPFVRRPIGHALIQLDRRWRMAEPLGICAERIMCPGMGTDEEIDEKIIARSVNEPVQAISKERRLISSSVSSTVADDRQESSRPN